MVKKYIVRFIKDYIQMTLRNVYIMKKNDKENRKDIINELKSRIYNLKYVEIANFTKNYRKITIEFYEKILKIIQV